MRKNTNGVAESTRSCPEVSLSDFNSASSASDRSAKIVRARTKNKLPSWVILERTTRKIKLTQEGSLFLVRARTILADLSDAEEALLKSDSDTSGQL
ncbi:hypothetical protein ACW7EJ_01165, partial [Acinetobacter soli]